MNKTDRLKSQIRKWGADIVGVADLTEDDAKSALSDVFHHYTRAVSMAIRIDPVKIAPNSSNGGDKSGQILCYMDENKSAVGKLNFILRHLKTEFRMRRFKYFALPPISNCDERKFSSFLFNLFPHRMAATCAGLGWIGKNGMLVNREFGPYLIWATFLTDAPLESSNAQIVDSACKGCSLCQSVCPASAIKGISWARGMNADELVDLNSCSDQMNSNTEEFGMPVCGICFMRCPLGAEKSVLRAS